MLLVLHSLLLQGTNLQKGLKELDEKIHVAKITVREERLNFDLRKAEVESQLSALKVRCLVALVLPGHSFSNWH